MDIADCAEGPLDPRIQIELENLNAATDNINKLEVELDEAHTAFRQLLSESTRRLTEIADKVGATHVQKSRCYFKALEVAEQSRLECQKQAKLFQRASEIHAAAKETVALAEARFMSHQHEWNFDQAWQDMLNHATIKVMDAENQKAECGREHHRRAMLFHDAEKKVQQLEEKLRRSIMKARPYFENRAHCYQMLQTQKDRVEYLQRAVKEAKRKYSSSLRALEEISNQIHQQRKDYDIVINGPREPGVGAELSNTEENLNYKSVLNKLNLNRVNSIASNETDADERRKDLEDVSDLLQRMEHLGGRSADGSESKSNNSWELELQASLEKLNNLSLGYYDAYNDTETAKNSSLCGETSCTSDGFKKPLNVTSVISSQSTIQSTSKNQFPEIPVDLRDLENTRLGISNELKAQTRSLTHSPINSNKHEPKLSLRSMCKSLTNSPINTGSFIFGGSRISSQNVKQSDEQNAVGSNKFDVPFQKSESTNKKFQSNSDINILNLDVKKLDGWKVMDNNYAKMKLFGKSKKPLTMSLLNLNKPCTTERASPLPNVNIDTSLRKCSSYGNLRNPSFSANTSSIQ